jgi:hypothetical protein
MSNKKLIEGKDFYIEDGFVVLTASFLLKRGYCCDNDCRHCPYRKKSKLDELQELTQLYGGYDELKKK